MNQIEKHEPRKQPGNGPPPEQSKCATVAATPFENGLRNTKGQFVAGHPGISPGSPIASAAIRRRQRLNSAIADADVDLCIKTLRDIASDADAKAIDRISAVKELLCRAIGSVVPADVAEQLAELQELVSRIERQRENPQ